MHCLQSLLLVLTVGAVVLPAQSSLIEVTPTTNPTLRAALHGLGVEVKNLGTVWHVVTDHPRDLARVYALGLDARLLVPDLLAHHQQQALAESGTLMDAGAATGSMGGFHTLAEMVRRLDRLVTLHPSIFQAKTSLGTSFEGRTIWAYKISDRVSLDEPEPEIVFVGGQHAREPLSVQAAVSLAERLVEGYGRDPFLTHLVEQREIWIIPCLNPDGYAFNELTAPHGGGTWRKTRRPEGTGIGTDPNRNWAFEWARDNIGSSGSPTSPLYRGPFAESEPCVAAVANFLRQRDPTIVVDLHSYGRQVLLPYSYQLGATAPLTLSAAVQGVRAQLDQLVAGWRAGVAWEFLPAANGTLIDWCTGALNGGGRTLGVALEIGSDTAGFWPAPSEIPSLVDESLLHMVSLIDMAGPKLTLQAIQAIDLSTGGPAAFGPNDSGVLRCTLSNVGMVSAAMPGVSLNTQDAWISSSGGAVGLPSIAPWSTSTVTGQVDFTIEGAAQPGARLDLPLVAQAQYAVPHTRATGLVVSQPPVVSLDADFEVAVGFTSGIPSDNATGGQWVLGDPIGSTRFAGSDLYNPEDDHTPGSGTQCWFTGLKQHATQSHTMHDVDGVTTLLSPLYDLTDVQDATLSFWRWVATTFHDDSLRVEASNDGGHRWTVLTIYNQHESAWKYCEFRLEDYLPLTESMRFRFQAADNPNNSLFECAVDDVRISGFAAGLTLRKETVVSGALDFVLEGQDLAGKDYFLGASLTANQGIPTGTGLFPLDPDPMLFYLAANPSIVPGLSGALDSTGTARIRVPLWQHSPGSLTIWVGAIVPDNGRILTVTGARSFLVP